MSPRALSSALLEKALAEKVCQFSLGMKHLSL